MRLLMLAPYLEIGGADKFNLDLIERLQRNHGYEVAVITTRSSPHRWREQFERLTPDVFTLHSLVPLEDYPRFIADFMERWKPDTVLIVGSRTGYELLPRLRTVGGPSFVDYLHIEDPDSRGYPQLSIRYAAYLDATVTSSEYLKQRQVESGADRSRLHVVTTNIDAGLWDRSRYDSVTREVPVIACVARITQQKQPDVLAAVLKTLRDRGVRFTCLVAGDGDQRRWLESFIARNRLHQVKMLGAVSSDQVREILAGSDLYFLPSESEGIALALFEAMSMGVVPVAADVGGQSELVTSDCGILIKPGPAQVTEYADALERLLADHELRASMAARSRERICNHFTLDEMAARMARLFTLAAKNPWKAPSIVPAPSPRAPRASAFRGFITTTFLLLSPRDGRLKVKNLNLLVRILLDGAKRRRLAEAFDSRYYLSHNPDLEQSGVSPLMHYLVQGYLEDRLPSAHFHTGGAGLNPMLWSILKGDRQK
jgi:glycosyltransferase involved in cell wall biosynthesis